MCPDGSIRSCCLDDRVKDEGVRNFIEKNSGTSFASSPNGRCLVCFESEPNRCKLLENLSIGDKIQVRYLELHWSWNGEQQEYFDKLIGGMNLLQTLDLRAGKHGDLPDYIWHIKTLRHVLLSGYTSGPPSWADLQNLQTLTGITNRESWLASEPDLPSLRTLDILLYRGFHGGRLASFVDRMKHLVFLRIVSEDIPLEVVDMRSYQCYQYLQSLYLREYRALSNNITLLADMFPRNLVELTLENFRLKQDPMKELEKLRCLRRLRLGYRACDIEELRCSSEGFLQLKQLELIALEKLKKWLIFRGAMPILEKLTASCCPLLLLPKGLIYLTNLQTLSWHREIEANKICQIRRHIPNISIVSCTNQ